MDIRDMKINSEPVFFYRFMFKVADSGRYVAKEGLIRGWLAALASINEDYVISFRKIMWGAFKSLDNEGFSSCYAGYEVVHFGFNRELSKDIETEIAQANSKCPTITCVRFGQIFDGVRGAVSLKALVELKLRTTLTEFNQRVLPSFNTGEFSIYKQTVGNPAKIVRCSVAYKAVASKEGITLYVLMPPRFSPVLALLKEYQYNTLTLQKLISCNVIGYFSSIKDSDSFEDIIHDRIIEMSGFTQVAASDSLDIEEDDSDSPDLEGA
jgi:hypothetical protein